MLKWIIGLSFTTLFSLFLLFPSQVRAATIPYTITEGIPSTPIDDQGYRKKFFETDLEIDYQGGSIWLSGRSDGTGYHLVDDVANISVTHEDGSSDNFGTGYHYYCWYMIDRPPLDLTFLFKAGNNRVHIELSDYCGVAVGSWPLYLVNLNAPEITPSPSPTPTPTPAPFLTLPWDYESKGLTFNEAALAINSYFDHTYPLLSAGQVLSEPTNYLNQVTTYRGVNEPEEPYSTHDGYDYGSRAKANLGNSVLAAASGSANFINSCKPCGNMIIIDHGNGYQTRYMHLQKDGLVSDTPNTTVEVEAGQQIGLVGATGNVWPSDERGAHIHFMVVQDKNRDGNFEDNVPDGMTDPFGWQSDTPDPWENYTFTYAGKERTGNKSYYLWKTSLEGTKAALTSEPKTVTVGRYTLDFPAGAVDNTVNLDIQSSPWQKLSDSIVSIGSTIWARAKDNPGNIITAFNNPFILLVDFSPFDLSRFKPETISFYFSEDGINWTKIEGTIVDLINKKAQVEVNHFSYFALMAERIDTIPPTTQAQVEGQEWVKDWYDSAVRITLIPQDPAPSLGLDYTMYRINDADWEIYKEALTLAANGSYKIEFYSADKDENIEEVKSVEFGISKDNTQAIINAFPNLLWPPDNRMVNITINTTLDTGNLLAKYFKVEDEYHLIEPTLSDFGQVISLQAQRDGSDLDGRQYKIKTLTKDKDGNVKKGLVIILVPHNKQTN